MSEREVRQKLHGVSSEIGDIFAEVKFGLLGGTGKHSTRSFWMRDNAFAVVLRCRFVAIEYQFDLAAPITVQSADIMAGYQYKVR